MVTNLQGKAAVRFTHIPTGASSTVEITGRFRSMHRARDMAMKYLRSKLWAKVHLLEQEKEVAVYELPDDVYFPHELSDFRNEAARPEVNGE